MEVFCLRSDIVKINHWQKLLTNPEETWLPSTSHFQHNLHFMNSVGYLLYEFILNSFQCQTSYKFMKGGQMTIHQLMRCLLLALWKLIYKFAFPPPNKVAYSMEYTWEWQSDWKLVSKLKEHQKCMQKRIISFWSINKLPWSDITFVQKLNQPS